MRYLFVMMSALAVTVSASAQTGNTGGREIISIEEARQEGRREVVELSTVKRGGGSEVIVTDDKIIINRIGNIRRDTAISVPDKEPVAIGFIDPFIIEEPSDHTVAGVYVKNGKEFLFGNSGETPKRARFGVIGGHWAGISFGYSGLVSDMGDWSLPAEGAYLEQRPNSPSVNINIIGLEIISTRHFALTTGIGLEFNNYRFREPMILRASLAGGTYPDYSIYDNGGRTDKSKLSTNYLNIPLLAEFRFGCKNGYSGKAGYLYGGVVGGWGYNVHSKIKYNSGSGRLHRTKDHDIGVANFRYGYTVGVGYSHWGLYMQYYPEPIFKEGPQVRQVSVGLSFNWGKVK